MGCRRRDPTRIGMVGTGDGSLRSCLPFSVGARNSGGVVARAGGLPLRAIWFNGLEFRAHWSVEWGRSERSESIWPLPKYDEKVNMQVKLANVQSVMATA